MLSCERDEDFAFGTCGVFPRRMAPAPVAKCPGPLDQFFMASANAPAIACRLLLD
jgi:hypothetical protein